MTRDKSLILAGMLAMADMFQVPTSFRGGAKSYRKKKQLPKKEWKRRKKLRSLQSHSRKINRS